MAPVFFGAAKDTPVLGATALEALGYQVDPVSKELKPPSISNIVVSGVSELKYRSSYFNNLTFQVDP